MNNSAISLISFYFIFAFGVVVGAVMFAKNNTTTKLSDIIAVAEVCKNNDGSDLITTYAGSHLGTNPTYKIHVRCNNGVTFEQDIAK